MIADTKYDISDNGLYVEAFSGAGNRERITFKPDGPYLNVKLDNKENFDFTANGCTKIEVTCNGEMITSTDNLVGFLNGALFVEFGAFVFVRGSYPYRITAYFGEDDVKGVVMNSEGRVNFNSK